MYLVWEQNHVFPVHVSCFGAEPSYFSFVFHVVYVSKDILLWTCGLVWEEVRLEVDEQQVLI
jgi:hypothetical protein